MLRAAGFVTTLCLILLPTHLPLGMEGPVALAATPLPLTIIEGTIQRNASLASTLDGLLSPAQVHEVVQSATPSYDLGRVAVGRPYGVALDPRGEVVAFTYGIDELRTLRLTRESGALLPEIAARDYATVVATAQGIVESSLFGAVTASGESDQLAMEMAEIFAWDIDFNTEIQKGDAFRVVVEKLSLDGEFRRYGRILAAEFRRGADVHAAVRFDDGESAGYYDLVGSPLRKAFLRSPLEFSRISSRFTYRRLHPVTKKIRPHLGVDYAAATGTPVRAAADGRVVGAGWMGGLGKAVHLQHANGMETLYGHLSRIGVRRGQRVAQGAIVGRVGSTGLATGPHLDYRMKRNGTYIDPLAHRSPPAEPVPPDLMALFEQRRDEALALLDPAVRRASKASPTHAN
jgi:murein DD-endopeptidase MepM/ murein hydrolase activator NlpD